MQPISYERVADAPAALAAARASDGAFYAGGTTLIDLMKLGVVAPRGVIDINRLPFAAITVEGGVLRLGALARMSDAADDARVADALPAVAQALGASASAQLRNMASLGGNVMQRTRCAYFRDIASACNKRRPGSGCGAREGISEDHAVLGTSAACIAVHASDFAVPLAAFDAVLELAGPAGRRSMPIGSFYRTPGTTPEIETELRAGELIESIDIPLTPAGRRSVYVKVRDRTSYAFALASCAAGVERSPDGTLADVRIALGGVGTVPWRARIAETHLRGKQPSRAAFGAAARAELAQARPTLQNADKIDLAIRTLVRALETVTQ